MLLQTTPAKVAMLKTESEKKGGKNKRISKKLRCASCGDMP
jgi:cytochrome c-type biogenesis protein CcmH/NrfF